MIQRPLSGRRARGDGVAHHTSPEDSSRRKIASPVGSLTGSFANGVSLFSRLFRLQLNADPDALTNVPNSGLAITFDQGSGVSRSPSSMTTYSRPSGVKPPTPLSRTSGGTGRGALAGRANVSSADGSKSPTG